MNLFSPLKSVHILEDNTQNYQEIILNITDADSHCLLEDLFKVNILFSMCIETISSGQY